MAQKLPRETFLHLRKVAQVQREIEVDKELWQLLKIEKELEEGSQDNLA